MKRFLCLILISVILLSQPISALSSQPQTVSNDFISALSLLYDDSNSQCSIKNNLGVDITESFIANTREYYENKDWNSIRNYYMENVENISIVTEKTFVAANGDIGKQVSEIQGGYANGVESIGPNPGEQSSAGWQNETIEYLYELVGTFYYNPNTGKISYADIPYARNMNVNPGGFIYDTVKEVTPRGVISSDQYSVTFSHSFNIRLQFGATMIYFERISNSFTAYADL